MPLAARCRLAFLDLEGVIAAWREAHDREPSPEVLARMLARYPGDPAEAAARAAASRDGHAKRRA